MALLEDALLSYLAPNASRIEMYLGLAEAHLLDRRHDKANDVIRRGRSELDTGKMDTGLYRTDRPEGAIPAAQIEEMRRSFDALADRARDVGRG